MGTLTLSPSMSFLVLLLLTLTASSWLAESKTYWGDTQVLKELKNSVDPNSMIPGSCLSSWDFSVDPCDNLFSDKFTCGFRCDVSVSELSRVTEVTLDQAGYSASSLSSVSWNLPYLETLDLSNNYFSGSIPGSLSNLTRLTRLGLSRNSFSGEIPTSIGSLYRLEELYLDYNKLEGTIPSSFNGLSSLKRLEIQSNKLSGEFPDLGSVKNLYYLDASDNLISGRVPETLPPSLVQITMRNSFLQGTVPESFKLLRNLQVLDLTHNNLSGSVPSLLFNHPSLEQLTLSFNKFIHIQPPPSNNIFGSQLIAIDISNNELLGILPLFMALMPKLAALSLENNKFSGVIPIQYAVKVAMPGPEIASFQRLLLGGNYLHGGIPRPLLELQPGSVNVRLADNCLYRCPFSFFFCQGARQKPAIECKRFNSIIP